MKKYQNFYLKTFVLVVKFSIYLNRRVFVMIFSADRFKVVHCLYLFFVRTMAIVKRPFCMVIISSLFLLP